MPPGVDFARESASDLFFVRYTTVPRELYTLYVSPATDDRADTAAASLRPLPQLHPITLVSLSVLSCTG